MKEKNEVEQQAAQPHWGNTDFGHLLGRAIVFFALLSGMALIFRALHP